MSIGRNESQADFAARLLASIGQPVLATDTNFLVIYANRGAEQTLGWRFEEIIGLDVLEAAGIALSDERAEALLAELADGNEVTQEFRLTRRSGEQIPVLVTLTPLLDESGSFVGMVAVGTDITDRLAMEAANRRMSAIVESSTDAIVGFDLEGKITSWNDAASSLFGYPATERIGQLTTEVVAEGWHGPTFVEQMPDLGSAPSKSYETEYERHDGVRLLVETTVQPVRDKSGNLVGGAAVCRDVTLRRELEQLASEDHQRLEEAQQIARIGSFDYYVRDRSLKTSRELRRIFGVGDDDDLSLERFFDILEPSDMRVFREAVQAKMDSGEDDTEITYRIRRTGDGEVRFLHTIARIAYTESGEPARVVGSTQDVTDLVRDEEARRLAEQQFSVAFDLGSVGMCILGLDRRIRQVNQTICRMFGREAHELVGHNPDEFSHPSDLLRASNSPTDALLASGQDHIEMERRYLRPDGEPLHTIVHLAIVRDAAGEPLYTLAQVVDITDRKRTEEELERLAMQDPLTGLPNRNLLQDRLATALKRSKRTRSKVAVMFVDIDHFKLVNDSLGHAAGDDLLRQVAHRLEGCTRAGDTVARFGGDEFVLVCEDVADAGEATLVGERVRRSCEEAFLIDEQPMYATVSCGVVVAAPGDTPLTLLRDADTAMYRAKERGRARVELFDADLRSRATKRLDIELALRRALEGDQFRLEYQPIMRLPDETPEAVEALLRWDHPDGRTVAPTEFVQAAEETGLIVPIGEWVLGEAVAQTARWRRTLPGAGGLVVSVNLSPRQLMSPDLLTAARDALVAYDLDPSGLCLEITESTVMDDVDVSLPLLRRIADSGIALAVDDFGAGYSSLSRLKRLPVRILKIDRSFVDGLGSDVDDSAIVRAIVGLGQALNLQLCAEGVETAVQREELVKLGCDTAQGYFWSRPLAVEAFEQWYGTVTAARSAAAGAL